MFLFLLLHSPFCSSLVTSDLFTITRLLFPIGTLEVLRTITKLRKLLDKLIAWTRRRDTIRYVSIRYECGNDMKTYESTFNLMPLKGTFVRKSKEQIM